MASQDIIDCPQRGQGYFGVHDQLKKPCPYRVPPCCIEVEQPQRQPSGLPISEPEAMRPNGSTADGRGTLKALNVGSGSVDGLAWNLALLPYTYLFWRYIPLATGPHSWISQVGNNSRERKSYCLPSTRPYRSHSATGYPEPFLTGQNICV